MRTIEIPKSVFGLGDGLLADCQFGCSSLDFIVILDSVKLIGQDAFTNTDKQFIIQCSFVLMEKNMQERTSLNINWYNIMFGRLVCDYQSTETTRVCFSYSSNEKIGVYYIRIN